MANRSLTRNKIDNYLREHPHVTNAYAAAKFGVTTATVRKIRKERAERQYEREAQAIADGLAEKIMTEVNNTDLEKGGVKYDIGKLPWHLLPGDALEEVVKVLDFGARKYRERNWEVGMKWSRCFGACMRHMWAYWKGEDNDPETGLSHLAHAMCCVMFLLSYHLRKVGTDDRPKGIVQLQKTTQLQEKSTALGMFPPDDYEGDT
jgi:Domain of unknown function (DUF5664)